MINSGCIVISNVLDMISQNTTIGPSEFKFVTPNINVFWRRFLKNPGILFWVYW